MKDPKSVHEFYKKTVEDTYKELGTSPDGLTGAEAEAKLNEYGPNAVKVARESLWSRIFEPFRSIFMLILGIAAIISLIMDEKLDAIIILVIIAITVCIYYVQRFSADRVLRALESTDKQMIRVQRDGEEISIDSEELVPGDVIALDEGEKVPADLRVVTAENIRSDEAMLTGESAPVSKNSDPLEEERHVYEQTNMLFQGAYIVSGSVSAVVTATGNQTEFGQLAALTQKTDLSSPVKTKIDKLITQIVGAVTIVSIVVFALSFYRGEGVGESLRLVLTLAVSSIPEGLPIAISVVLVLGMRRMAKLKALVRNMTAIENIGIVTTIATDKTGTLTKNELSVGKVWNPYGAEASDLVRAMYLSINMRKGKLHDPLDNAFMMYAESHDEASPAENELIKSMPFEYQFAMSGNTYKTEKGYEIFLKGAPERLLEMSHISDERKRKVVDKLHELTSDGFRVIALAQLRNHDKPIEELEEVVENELEFLGLIAVSDELRPESKPSIRDAQSAGVTVRMVTGDHFETAYSIGKQLGLAESKEQVFDCSDIESMTDKEIEEKVAGVRVFSRVLPEYKHRILGILKKNDIAAMTGDGVNDVPALSNAHIGIAMGSGSQIAKEAGDIVLLDDNFKSITAALEQGRVIFDNIRRMLYYLLSTNLGEVMTIVAALAVGMPLPILPVQILWINLGTDTAMVIPLGLEPAERDVMKRKPRPASKPILNKPLISRMILVGATMMIVSLGFFHHYLQFQSEEYARSIVFNILIITQLANAVNARSEWQSFITRLRVVNYKFYAGLILAFGFHYLAMRGPLMEVLHLEYVSTTDIFATGIVAVIAVVFAGEVHKFIGRKYFGSS